MVEESNLSNKTKRATKWSLATEVVVKLVSPISQLILARLLAPEAFGMVATVTMLVSFADMFADAGFQKYLVQRKFSSRIDLFDNANVAFWTNLVISILLWILVIIFRDPLASFVGNPSLGFPLAVACASLPLTSFSSIQMAIFHRDLDFKSLLPIRFGGSVLTLITTVSMAILGFDYWSLIVGTLLGGIFNAIALTVRSSWRPAVYYSYGLLKKMFSFSGWTLLESISIWISTWSGTFVIGSILGSTDVGFYRTSISLVGGIFGVVSNATTPILFSSLSKLQDDKKGFDTFFFKFQFTTSLFLLPLSVFMFSFRMPLVSILLGVQWMEATTMFGLYALLQGPMILMSYYCSEIYRSLGKPRVSMAVQCLFVIVMIPVLCTAAQFGFASVVYADAVMRLFLIIINQITVYHVARISFIKVLRNIKEPLIASGTVLIFGVAITMLIRDEILSFLIYAVVFLPVYVGICLAFGRTRKIAGALFHRYAKR